VTKDGVETSFTHEFPKAGVVQTPKPLGICAFVRDLDPVISVKQGYIPLNLCAKFGIDSRFSAAQPAVDGACIESRVLRHSLQQRRHVLHGVPADVEHLISAVSHRRPPTIKRGPLAFILKERTDSSSSPKVYIVNFGVSSQARLRSNRLRLIPTGKVQKGENSERPNSFMSDDDKFNN
jgi:hypothetical protein